MSRAAARPFAALTSPREVVRQFTPNWFAVAMGTGVVALLLGQRPVGVLHDLGRAMWLANIGLFAVFTLLYAARWALYPSEARNIFAHGTVSMMFGTVPMALATIVNGLLLFGVPLWGAGVMPVAYTLWILDALLAAAAGLGVPYLMFTRQEHRLDQMTAVWLLPVVASEVAAVTAGLLVPHVAAPDGLGLLVAGYVLWALSVPLAIMILTILLLRLAVHQLPHESMAPTAWLALGPLGSGALALLVLGDHAPAVMAARGLTDVGRVMSGAGVLGALLMLGFGLWWLALGLLVTARYFRRSVPFNLGWWAYIFPMGVYTLGTLKLGAVLAMPRLVTAGLVLSAVIGAVWLYVAARTAHGAWRGDLFVSPCIAGLAPSQLRAA